MEKRIISFLTEAEDAWIAVDANHGRVENIRRCDGDKNVTVCRPLTASEKREVMGTTLSFGQRSMPYLLWRVLMLWLTKSVYPEQTGQSPSIG